MKNNGIVFVTHNEKCKIHRPFKLNQREIYEKNCSRIIGQRIK